MRLPRLSLTKSVTRMLVAVVIVAATAASARADIIVLSQVINDGTANVLLTNAVDVPVVTGTVNSGAFDVFFQSTGGNLDAPAQGQARVSPAIGNDPFTNISFYVVDALFTRAVFNLNSASDGDMMIRVLGVNIAGGVFEELVEVDANGENFFTISAINGQFMRSVELLAQGNVEFEDLRQVRLGGLQRDVTVPEPATLLLLGAGLVFAAARLRRRL